MCCIKIALRRSFFKKTAQSIANGTDKGGSFVTVVRLETKLRATLTEQQKALFEQINKRISICIAASVSGFSPAVSKQLINSYI